MAVPTQLAIATRRMRALAGVAPCVLFIRFPRFSTVDERQMEGPRLPVRAAEKSPARGRQILQAFTDRRVPFRRA